MSDRRYDGGLLRRKRAEPPPLHLRCFAVRARIADSQIVRTATFRALNATHAEALALDAFPDCFLAIATEVEPVRGFPLPADARAARDQQRGAR